MMPTNPFWAYSSLHLYTANGFLLTGLMHLFITGTVFLTKAGLWPTAIWGWVGHTHRHNMWFLLRAQGAWPTKVALTAGTMEGQLLNRIFGKIKGLVLNVEL